MFLAAKKLNCQPSGGVGGAVAHLKLCFVIGAPDFDISDVGADDIAQRVVQLLDPNISQRPCCRTVRSLQPAVEAHVCCVGCGRQADRVLVP